MKVHPAAELFPLIEGDDFEKLCAGFRAHGFNEQTKIVRIWQESLDGTREALILDGRNRLRACEATGVEPQFVDYTGDDPIRFVVEANMNRRHMDESQRGMVSARIARLRHGQKKADASIEATEASSQDDAARQLNVGRSTVQRARVVLEHGVAGLAAAVDRGEVSVGAAADVARLPVQKQRQLVAEGADAVKAAASEVRRAKREERTVKEPEHAETGDRHAVKSARSDLSQRESDVLALHRSGVGTTEIAERLGVSVQTVCSVKGKLGISSTSAGMKLRTGVEHTVTQLSGLTLVMDDLTKKMNAANELAADKTEMKKWLQTIAASTEAAKKLHAAAQKIRLADSI